MIIHNLCTLDDFATGRVFDCFANNRDSFKPRAKPASEHQNGEAILRSRAVQQICHNNRQEQNKDCRQTTSDPSLI